MRVKPVAIIERDFYTLSRLRRDRLTAKQPKLGIISAASRLPADAQSSVKKVVGIKPFWSKRLAEIFIFLGDCLAF